MGVWCLLVVTYCFLSLVNGQGVTIQPEEVSGIVGDVVNITCIVGTTEPGFTQLQTSNNELLPYEYREVQEDRVVFGYGPLTAEDDGLVVICHFGTVEANGTISVLVPAMFSLEPSTRTVSEGTVNYVLFLTVTGDPLPTNEETTWTFNGGALGEGVTVTYNTLTIDAVSRDHSGVYSVRAVTSAGPSNTFDITVSVTYPPSFTAELSPDISCGGVAPSFTCAMRVGDSGSLSCQAVGVPTPEVTHTLYSQESPSVTSTSVSVAVGPVTAGDDGTTVDCTASNSEGVAVRNFTIYLGVPPALPTNVVARVEGDMVVVTWSHSDDGNSVPLFEFVYRVTTSTGEEVISGSTSSMTISVRLSLLEENTRYNVEVWATNLLGDSPVAGAQFTTPLDLGGGSLMLVCPTCVSVLLMVMLALVL